MKKYWFWIGILTLQLSCQQVSQQTEEKMETTASPQAISFLGDSLYSPEPNQKILTKYQARKDDHISAPDSLNNIIWFGRFAAYKGDYLEAINIYSQGIEKYPKEPRLYRHRGHRYITIRKIDAAIKDLKYASELITDIPNKMEEDGLPNAMNIPVSSTHGNIWYHLGLAYYLKHDFENALDAYKQCLLATNNDDNVVSATHWIYMILQRLDRSDEANEYLAKIAQEMNVIENMAYHKACLFYKGEITLEEFSSQVESGSGGDAMKYALGNWHFYNGQKEVAEKVYRDMLATSAWNSFGYIAAEADLSLVYP